MESANLSVWGFKYDSSHYKDKETSSATDSKIGKFDRKKYGVGTIHFPGSPACGALGR